jgi:hypothetical protein
MSKYYPGGEAPYASSSSSGGGPTGPTGGSFGTFLDEVQGGSSSSSSRSDHYSAPELDGESRIIEALTTGGAKDVAQLMYDSRCLPLPALLHALDILQRYGLISRRGEPGEDLFELTPSGIRTAKMMGFHTIEG